MFLFVNIIQMNVLKLIIGLASIGAGIFIVVDGTLWGGLVVVVVGIALLTTTALSKRLHKVKETKSNGNEITLPK